MSEIVIPAEALAAVAATSARKSQMAEESFKAASADSVDRKHLLMPSKAAVVYLESAADVTLDVEKVVLELAETYLNADDWVDWEVFFDRLESSQGLSVVDLGCPASQKIRRIVRQFLA